MNLFDLDAQTDTDGKRMSEGAFAYLNHSAKPSSAVSRDLVNDWLSYVPAFEQAELIARFRSGDDIQFGTSFQELFLHEFLRRQKCTLDFHPIIPENSKKPDSLVGPPWGTVSSSRPECPRTWRVVRSAIGGQTGSGISYVK